MQRELITKYHGQNVAIGLRHYSRDAPFFFYGRLLEVNENYCLTELEHGKGFKSINLMEILDIHLDPQYQEERQQ